MKSRLSNRSTRGLTLTEVILTLTVVVLVAAAVLLPVIAKSRARSSRINCISLVKQVGLAFRMFSSEHGEKFPWAVSTNEGGTLEYANSSDVFRHYLSVSNELSSPKVLVCTADDRRTKVGAWDQFTGNKNLSYFAGLDADETKPLSILSGDRNIATNGHLAFGLITITNWLVIGWGAMVHSNAGNIGFGDGSAQQFTTAGLPAAFQAALTNFSANSLRLAIP